MIRPPKNAVARELGHAYIPVLLEFKKHRNDADLATISTIFELHGFPAISKLIQEEKYDDAIKEIQILIGV